MNRFANRCWRVPYEFNASPTNALVLSLSFLCLLQISTYRDELQGQCGAGFSCLVFEGSVDAPLEPITPSTTYTLTDTDLHKVDLMRESHAQIHISI